MSKSRIKRDTPRPAGWDVVITDAEEEIAALEERIARLRRVILGARVQIDAGVPFPELPPDLDD